MLNYETTPYKKNRLMVEYFNITQSLEYFLNYLILRNKMTYEEEILA